MNNCTNTISCSLSRLRGSRKGSREVLKVKTKLHWWPINSVTGTATVYRQGRWLVFIGNCRCYHQPTMPQTLAMYPVSVPGTLPSVTTVLEYWVNKTLFEDFSFSNVHPKIHIYTWIYSSDSENSISNVQCSYRPCSTSGSPSDPQTIKTKQ